MWLGLISLVHYASTDRKASSCSLREREAKAERERETCESWPARWEGSSALGALESEVDQTFEPQHFIAMSCDNSARLKHTWLAPVESSGGGISL